MAFSLAQLTALEDAISQGALRVKFSDREVQYRSLEEMIRLRDLMRKELGVASAPSKRIVMVYDKGEK